MSRLGASLARCFLILQRDHFPIRCQDPRLSRGDCLDQLARLLHPNAVTRFLVLPYMCIKLKSRKEKRMLSPPKRQS